MAFPADFARTDSIWLMFHAVELMAWWIFFFPREFEISQAMNFIFFFNYETSDVSQLNILPGSLFRVAWSKKSKFVSMR